jgi:hypothetical protein
MGGDVNCDGNEIWTGKSRSPSGVRRVQLFVGCHLTGPKFTQIVTQF